jgi:hypothetical protein
MNSQENILRAFECPISLVRFTDPVIAADGHTYERASIEEWLKSKSGRSPMDNSKMDELLIIPNKFVKSLQKEIFDKQGELKIQSKLNFNFDEKNNIEKKIEKVEQTEIYENKYRWYKEKYKILKNKFSEMEKTIDELKNKKDFLTIENFDLHNQINEKADKSQNSFLSRRERKRNNKKDKEINKNNKNFKKNKKKKKKEKKYKKKIELRNKMELRNKINRENPNNNIIPWVNPWEQNNVENNYMKNIINNYHLGDYK